LLTYCGGKDVERDCIGKRRCVDGNKDISLTEDAGLTDRHARARRSSHIRTECSVADELVYQARQCVEFSRQRRLVQLTTGNVHCNAVRNGDAKIDVMLKDIRACS